MGGKLGNQTNKVTFRSNEAKQHDSNKEFKRLLSAVKGSQIKEALKKYKAAQILKGNEDHTIGLNCYYLYKIAKEFNGNINPNKITPEMVTDWLEAQRKKGTKNSSINKIWVTLASFIRWYFESHLQKHMPLWVKQVKLKKDAPTISERNVLTHAEVSRGMEHCNSIKGKALIGLLFESCLRGRSELMRVKLGDIELKDRYAIISVKHSKSKYRNDIFETTIIQHFPLLLELIEINPNRNNPNAWLFFVNGGRQWSSIAANTMVKAAFKRAEIKKPAHLHALRHAGISDRLKRGFTEADVRVLANYATGSPMVSRVYGHVRKQDLRKKDLILNGVIEDSEKKPRAVECTICGLPNQADAQYCSRCRSPISTGALYIEQANKKSELKEIKEQMVYIQQVLDRILTNQQLSKAYSSWNKKTGKGVSELAKEVALMRPYIQNK